MSSKTSARGGATAGAPTREMSMVRGTAGHERLDSRFGFEDMLDRIRQLQVSCAGAVAALDERFDRGTSTTDCIQVRFAGSPAHLAALVFCSRSLPGDGRVFFSARALTSLSLSLVFLLGFCTDAIRRSVWFAARSCRCATARDARQLPDLVSGATRAASARVGPTRVLSRRT